MQTKTTRLCRSKSVEKPFAHFEKTVTDTKSSNWFCIGSCPCYENAFLYQVSFWLLCALCFTICTTQLMPSSLWRRIFVCAERFVCYRWPRGFTSASTMQRVYQLFGSKLALCSSDPHSNHTWKVRGYVTLTNPLTAIIWLTTLALSLDYGCAVTRRSSGALQL